MTRRHIEILATTFRDCLTEQHLAGQKTKFEAIAGAVRTIALALHADNPRFEVKRFLRDCGLEGENEG